MTRFEGLEKSRKLSSDDKYLATMVKSGTLSDRVAALTLTSQASPLHSLLQVSQLITMASKKARRESLMAVDSLKDLFVNTLLPDNAKLRFFHEHPLRVAQKSPVHLLLWLFEHCLKTAYAQLTSVLAAGMDDAVDSYKRACLRAANTLLRAKPEQAGGCAVGYAGRQTWRLRSQNRSIPASHVAGVAAGTPGHEACGSG